MLHQLPFSLTVRKQRLYLSSERSALSGLFRLRNMLHTHLALNLAPLHLDLLIGFIVVSFLKLRLPDSLDDVNTLCLVWVSEANNLQ